MTRFVWRGAAAALAIGVSTPALADHTGLGSGLSQSGPIVTIAADTLPAGSLAGSITTTWTDPDAYSDAELIAYAGQHVHAHTTDYNLQGAATLAYGLTGHITLAARLPWVRRDDLRAGHHSHSGGVTNNTVEELGTVAGVGDLTLLGQYLFTHDHAAGWGVALIAGLKVPTGATHKADLAGDRLETEHQPGTGSWDPLLGLAASKAWGPVSLHGSAIYQISTKGAQDTELGDRLNLDAALVYALSGGEHHHEDVMAHTHGGFAVMLEANYEREGKERIAGSIEDETGAETLWLSPGLRYSSPSGWTAALSAGIPVWQDIGPSHPNNSFRLTAQVGTKF